MFCKYCGKELSNNTDYCMGCGAVVEKDVQQNDSSSAAFAAIGFFIPIVGLILYIAYGKKMPKRAKSAGKGALIGYITNTVLATVFLVFYFSVLFSSIYGYSNSVIDVLNKVDYYSELADDSDESLFELKDYIVEIGEYNVFANQHYTQGDLTVYVNNIFNETKTFAITFEAYDENGDFIKSHKVYTETLGPNGTTVLTLFDTNDFAEINTYQYATFEVTDIYEID